MSKIAVIGAGVSGLSIAQMLRGCHKVVVFEANSTPGGLIRCKRVNGSLFHTCGGHVFNSKKQEVLDWFWKRFDRDKEFTLTDRNSVVFMPDGKHIPYPIENHAYLFSDEMLKRFVKDIVEISRCQNIFPPPVNFEEFLRRRFGETLYNSYFQPYNKKVWRRDLSSVPLSWLEGKLPMPTVEEMIYNNIHHVEEKQFVHSRFYYEKEGGSQLIADRLAEGLDIRYNQDIKSISNDNGHWTVNGDMFEKVVFCGNLKAMPSIFSDVDWKAYADEIDRLEYHGTTAVFCEIDKNPYSWIYQPSPEHESHRIICTGNFSATNNAAGKMTGTIEFTDYISEEDIKDNLTRIPLHPKYISHQFNECTYPIQDRDTREMVQALKKELAPKGLFFTGRFADWEYYNMDVAIDAAMKTVNDMIRA